MFVIVEALTEMEFIETHIFTMTKKAMTKTAMTKKVMTEMAITRKVMTEKGFLC